MSRPETIICPKCPAGDPRGVVHVKRRGGIPKLCAYHREKRDAHRASRRAAWLLDDIPLDDIPLDVDDVVHVSVKGKGP